MPQEGLDELRVDALRQEQRRAGVSEVVEAYGRQARRSNKSVAAVCLVAAWKVISGKAPLLRIFLKEVVITQGCM